MIFWNDETNAKILICIGKGLSLLMSVVVLMKKYHNHEINKKINERRI